MSGSGGEGSGGESSGGILSGLSNLLRQLETLVETGDTLERSGEFGDRDGFHGVYGVSVRLGSPADGPRVEPFGNWQPEETGGGARVSPEREPLVDLMVEEDSLRVVAEMPGVTRRDLRLSLAGDVLILAAARAGKRYRKEVLLPWPPTPLDDASLARAATVNNGIVEIRLSRGSSPTTGEEGSP